MQIFDYQGKKIAYYLNGENNGTPVVLIHGFCEDSRLWDEWLDFVPQRLYLRIDLPGSGFSDLWEDLSIEKMAEAVDAVLGHLGIGQCILVGHSMGGYVSLAFAEQHPDKLLGLCMFHSHPFADSEEKQAGRDKAIQFIQKNGHILYVRQTIPALFIYDYSKGYQMEVNKLIHNATYFAPEAIIASLLAMRNRPDRSEVLKNIQCPVLFFIGKHDTAVPYDLSMQMVHLPNLAVIHLLNTVGHMGMYSAQRETAKVFKQFLAKLEGEEG
jgi:pimeloyl-ACP methyl ester carboxylesterase